MVWYPLSRTPFFAHDFCTRQRSANDRRGGRSSARLHHPGFRWAAIPPIGLAWLAAGDPRKPPAPGSVGDCDRPAGSRAAAALAGHSPSAHRRRVQLPADGRHLRTLPPQQSHTRRMAALRDLSRELAAHVSLEVRGRARIGARLRRDRLPSTVDWGLLEHGADVRRHLLGTASLSASRLGAAGCAAGYRASRFLFLLDELVLGRIDGGPRRRARSWRRGSPVGAGRARAKARAPGWAVRPRASDAGHFATL